VNAAELSRGLSRVILHVTESDSQRWWLGEFMGPLGGFEKRAYLKVNWGKRNCFINECS
jgi:hypothetical protein